MMGEAERRAKMEQRQERRLARQRQQHTTHRGAAAARQGAVESRAAAAPPAAAAAAAVVVVPVLQVLQPLEDFQLPPHMTKEIDKIEEYYQKSSNDFQYTRNKKCSTADPHTDATAAIAQQGSKGVIGTWMLFCKKIGHFFSLFSDFSSLGESDQTVLMRTAMTSAGIIMGSVMFEYWTKDMGSTAGGAGAVPSMTMENIRRIVPGDLLFRVQRFFQKFRLICPNQTMAKILILVSLYSPELPGLKDDKKVQKLQEHYIDLLECYIKANFKESAGHKFANALVSLADVRELAERSLEMEIGKSMLSDPGTTNNDSSNGGNDGERKGNGGGSFGGPSTSGGSGEGPSGFSDAQGSSSSSGFQGRGFNNYANDGSGSGSSDTGSCGDNFTYQNANISLYCKTDGKQNLPSNHFLDSSFTVDSDRPLVDVVDSLQDDLPNSSGASDSFDDTSMTKRQWSDLRIQQLFNSIPQPAVMKIIYTLSTDLDIEAKEIDGSLKFLRKRGQTFSNDNAPNKYLSTRRKSYSSPIIKVENSCPPGPEELSSFLPTFSGVSIKEEQMDVDAYHDSEIDAINEIMTEIDFTATLCEPNPVASLDHETAGVKIKKPVQSSFCVTRLPETSFYTVQSERRFDPVVRGRHCIEPSFDYQQQRHHHRRHHHGDLRTRTSHERFMPAVRRVASHGKPSSPMPCTSSSIQLDVVSSSIDGGHFDAHGLASFEYQTQGQPLVEFSAATSLSESNGSEGAHRIPSATSDASGVACLSPMSSSQVHSSTSPLSSAHRSLEASHVQFQQYQCPVSKDDSVDINCPVVSINSSVVSPVSYSAGESSSCHSSSNVIPPTSYSSTPLSESTVHRQIMAMSLHSPGSPHDSNSSGSGVASAAGVADLPLATAHQHHPTQFTGYFSQIQQPSALAQQLQLSNNSSQQQRSQHQFLHNTVVRNGSAGNVQCINNRDFFHRKDFDSPHDSATSTTSPMTLPPPNTPSPCPSAISINSSSSSSNYISENSTDYGDKSLLNLNLSSLSDVEASVLQRFFDHIDAHVTEQLRKGNSWNSDGLLPQSFLEMLQDKLKTGQ